MIPSRPIRLAVFAAVVLAGPLAAVAGPTPEQKAAAAALRDACKADYVRLCKDVSPGGGRILACLDAHRDDLSPMCRDALASARDLRRRTQ